MEFQPKLGETVGVPIDRDYRVQEGSSTLIQGTVVAVEHDDEGLDICVGFKGTGKGIPHDACPLNVFDPICFLNSNVAPNFKSFDSFLWIYHDQLEQVSIPQTEVATYMAPIGGVSCSKCGEGNPWGAPNQADGTFICSGCRRH